MSRPGCCGTQQSKGTRNEPKSTRTVKTSQRDRNQIAPLKCEISDVRVELDGQDETRQDKDASEETRVDGEENAR